MSDDEVRLAGEKIYGLVKKIYPICRSISGDGVRQTYDIIDEYISESGYKVTRTEIPTGTQVLDWTIPKEWKIREACIEDDEGNHIVGFKKCNLHVMGYSAPVDGKSRGTEKVCLYGRISAGC